MILVDAVCSHDIATEFFSGADWPCASSLLIFILFALAQSLRAVHLRDVRRLGSGNSAYAAIKTLHEVRVPLLVHRLTIGRSAMPTKGSLGDMQAELEHLTSHNGGRGSRPIGIPRSGTFGPSTYHHAAGVFMQGFVPPHELAAASVQESEPMVRRFIVRLGNDK